MEIAIATGLFTLGGASLGFLGSVVANYISGRNNLNLNKQTAQIDLYKIVFPDKYIAAKDVMSKANNLMQSAMVACTAPDLFLFDSETNDSISVRVNDFIHIVNENAWLLGDEAAKNGKLFALRIEIMRRVTDIQRLEEEKHLEKITASFNKLSASLRDELGFSALAGVVPKHPVGSFSQRHSRLKKSRTSSSTKKSKPNAPVSELDTANNMKDKSPAPVKAGLSPSD